MLASNKRLSILLLIAGSILLIPLIGMQFSTSVNWSLADFAIAGLLLFGTALSSEIILRNIKNSRSRSILIIILIFVLLLVWAELAVGVFGSPIAGS